VLNRFCDHRHKVGTLILRDWATNVTFRAVGRYQLLTVTIEYRGPRYSAVAITAQLFSDFLTVLHLLNVNLQDQVIISEQSSVRIEELLEYFAPASPRRTKVHHDTLVLHFRTCKRIVEKFFGINTRFGSLCFGR
jgi:hypothetical protein